MKIDIIAGARPNFMKIAPIISAIINVDSKYNLSFRLIHTGQHYDDNMSGIFFRQLEIPPPEINLGVGSGTQSQQTAQIMIEYERVLIEKKSDMCIVVGDVNSTMACSIVAKKMGLKIAHIEAGIRSFDLTMPEEINRMVTDAITDYFFTTSSYANENLKKIGIKESHIFYVGNTMIDTLLKLQKKFIRPLILDQKKINIGEYFIMTMHRPSNVDQLKKLQKILITINNNVNNYPILFPVHPRTEKKLKDMSLKLNNIIIIPPLSYLEFNYLVYNSKCVITDSGGITEETTVMNIPCMTLRDNTERPETIIEGTNELVGSSSKKIISALNKLFSGKWKQSSIPKYWDGHTSKRIVEIILNL